METLAAKKMRDREDFISQIDRLPRAYVKYYPWNCDYRPETYACMGWNEENLFLYMRSYEDSIRAEAGRDNGDIYRDSCMEFFFSPDPDRPDWFANIEMNPNGYLYLAYGPEDSNHRNLFTSDAFGHFDLEVQDPPRRFNGEYWDLVCVVPAAYVRQFAPDFQIKEGGRLRANFFKCGDGTKHPHYGCWSEIIPDSAAPDFYRTEYFGEIEFVR